MMNLRSKASWVIVGFMIIFVLWQGWMLNKSQIDKQTAQRIAEEERKRLELIVFSDPSAIILCGPDRKIRLVNPAASELFGYDEGELPGQNIDILLPKELRNAHRRAFNKAVNVMRKLDGDWLLAKTNLRQQGIKKDGEPILISHTIRLIKYDGRIEVISSMRRLNKTNRPPEIRHMPQDLYESMR